MGNEDRRERSRETQTGSRPEPSLPKPGPSGVPNEGRGVERAGGKSGDEDEDESGSKPTGRGTAGTPDVAPPKQYVGGSDKKPE